MNSSFLTAGGGFIWGKSDRDNRQFSPTRVGAQWTGGKRKWAEGRNNRAVARRRYNEAFDEWGVQDAQDMVLRDRNHPSDQTGAWPDITSTSLVNFLSTAALAATVLRQVS